VTVQTPIRETARVMQLRGLFDLPVQRTSTLSWEAELPLDEQDWSIGLIVGPSGSGKSTIARECWPKEIATTYRWPKDRSVVEGFPEALAMKEITELLSSVGFSSPPAWLRPYQALSNGEQFRATMARTLAEKHDLAVVDEFTSVVDRTVAQIGSAAIAKTVRRRGQKLIAVTCHEDVEAWLTPDWVYRPDVNEFSWGCLQRPGIELDISRCERRLWEIFAPHHYLDHDIHRGAVCFAAYWRDRPVAFAGWLPQPNRNPMRRLSRSVCLPDFQGVGIGHALNTQTAAMWKALGEKPIVVSTHPAVISALNRSTVWALTRKPARSAAESRGSTKNYTHATKRRTAGFQYVGPALSLEQARQLRAA
jgi:hypothetical protein